MPVNHVYNNIFSLLALDMSVRGDENVKNQEKEYRRKYPLHTAAKFDLEFVVKFLVAFCFQDVNLLDNEKRTPLHVALLNGSVDAVKWLIPVTTFDPTKQPKKQTWLHMAVESKHLEIVENVLHYQPNVDVNLLDANGKSAFHIAVESSNLEIVKEILQRQPNVDVNVLDANGKSAVHIAVENDMLDILELLMQKNPNLEAQKGRKSVYDYVKSEKAELLLQKTEVKQQSGKLSSFLRNKPEFIASGTFGDVFKFPLESGRLAAVKKMKFDKIDNHKVVDETEIIDKICHLNIVRFFDLGCDEDSILCIFMEFVDGETLRKWIDKRKLTKILINSFTKQLVECLCYLKNEEIMHRDLSPNNIMIRSKDNVVKLTDFGEATAGDISTCDRTAKKGAPCYMAPEMQNIAAAAGTATNAVNAFKNLEVKKKAFYSYKVDVWSLGAVFFEMWTENFEHLIKPQDMTSWSEFIIDLREKLIESVKVEKEIDDYHTIDSDDDEEIVEYYIDESVMEFFDSTIVEDYKERLDPSQLRDLAYIQRTIITTESSKEVTLSFRPWAVAVIADIYESYAVNVNGEIVKSRDGELCGPLIIVGEYFISDKLFVYNKDGDYVGFVKLNEKMDVEYLISWKNDLMFVATVSSMKCINMEGTVLYQTGDDFKYIRGLCLVTDKIVAVCDIDDNKVVLIKTEDLSFISSVSIEKPGKIAKINDNELIVGCEESRRYHKISNMETVTELTGYDEDPWDMKSLRIDNTVLVLTGRYIDHLQINNNSIINYGTIINIGSYCYHISHFINNNQLNIVATVKNNKKLHLHKMNMK